ncbi:MULTISPECIES: hypothetical protein [Calothrix]|uniref:Uncharacterized protein n=2 Tax=Calothrix TaxID=1186 RepID=A0ABR8AL38_9CYAN|nr:MULTISPECIES: hypothetical protein [Calothrix]MBD2200701.1 hypothetical protein [Calothrix parietina FACHB-288]MBD2229749.1 hypothetical protein [Calothrix anomala FACHB-343]
MRSPNQVLWGGVIAIVIENQVRSPPPVVCFGAIAIVIENQVRSPNQAI